MQFKDIVGQKQVKEKLIKSVNEDRIAHAQLFVGQEGTGALALAIAYAQYISCLNRKDDDSCGVCTSCHKYQKLIHPDLHFVFPVNETKSETDDKSRKGSDAHMEMWRETIAENPYISESKWYEDIGLENKLGIISAAESSEVIRKISLKSFESDYKIMIIWLPERMNLTSANRLLKLIEEPPGETVFLLVSEQPTLIIGTILSRAQTIKIPPILKEDIEEALISKFDVSPQDAVNASRIANGNFLKALTLSTSYVGNPFFPLFQDIMRIAFSKNYLKLQEWVETAARLGRERQRDFLKYALRVVRESFMINLKLNDIAYVTDEEKEFCTNFSPFISGKNIIRVTETFSLAYEHISRNGNAQIIFTDMAIQLTRLINSK